MPVSVLLANRAALPAVGGDVVPSVTANPTLASDGTPQVGESITQGAGTATGTPTPTPTMTLEVSANGSSGWSTQTATSNWQAADETKYFRTKVVWNNSAGSATAYSSVVGPIAEASEGTSPQLYGDAVLPAAIELKAASSVTAQPFTVGLPLARGVLPSGQYLTLGTATALSQVVKTTWDDGSAKMVILSGKLTNGGSAYTSCAIGSTATPPGGSPLTESDLTAAGHTLSVQVGAIGTVTLASLIGQTANSGNGFTGRLRTWLSTANCSEWHYTAPVGSDAHLRVHIYARLYSGGKCWFLVAVDNSTLRVAGLTSKTYVPAVTINGSTVYNNGGSPLTQRARQAWALEFWSDGFGGWTPKHDTANLMSTKLVPNYEAPAPSSLYSDAKMVAAQTNTPLAVNALPTVLSWWPGGLTGGGASAHIGVLPLWDAAYFTSSGDSRTFKAIVNTSYAAGSYVRLLDETTCEPVRMTTVGNGDLGGGHYYHWANGAENLVVESGDLPWQHEGAHMPSMGFLAYLLTGNHWHLETCINAATACHMMAPLVARGYQNGVITAQDETHHPVNETRAVAWSVRSYGQAAAIAPDGSNAKADFTAVLNNTLEDLYAITVSGTRLAGAWANNVFGVTPFYGAFNGGYLGADTSYWDNTFMHHFMVMAVGYVSQCAPISNAAHVQSTLAHLTKWPVGVSKGGDFNRRRGFTAYEFPILSAKGAGGDFIPPLTFHTWASALAKYQGYFDNSGYPRDDSSRALGSTTDVVGESLLETASNANASGTGLGQGADGYGANALASLVTAVDLGASGAAKAYAEIQQASNFETNRSGRGETPQFQFTPRSTFSPESSLPAWAASVSTMTWYRIPNTKMSVFDAANGIVQRPQDGTGPSSKIVAWNGAAYSRARRAYIIAAAGGHGDYAGNEVQLVRLGVNTPAWEMPKRASADADMCNGPVFNDGRRAATHQYMGCQYIESLDRTFIMQCYGVDGVGWPSAVAYPNPAGAGSSPWGWKQIMAFCHGTGDWDPPDRWAAWPSAPGHDAFYGCFGVVNPLTNECYAASQYGGGIHRFNAGSTGANTWTTNVVPAADPYDYLFAGVALDPVRKRVLMCGSDQEGKGPRVYDLAAGTVLTPTFGGLGAAAITFSGSPYSVGVVFDELNDCFWVFSHAGGNPWRVRASDWYVDQPSISGTAPGARAGGWQNSWQYDPTLKGIVCATGYTEDLLYLRTSA